MKKIPLFIRNLASLCTTGRNCVSNQGDPSSRILGIRDDNVNYK